MKTIPQQPTTGPGLAFDKAGFQTEWMDILHWWSTHMVDEEQGGFYGQCDAIGRIDVRADKGVILNTRILWTYAAAALVTGQARYRELADRAYDYLSHHFWDEVEGGVVWTVDYLGNPVDTQKQIYGQAFAIYALAEYYFLTKDPVVLDQATELFWLIEKYSLDRELNGYLSAFARDWSPMADIRLSEKDMNEAKIMNTHIHILEAYTNFYRLKPFTALREALTNVIELLLDYFILPETHSLQVYFDENWVPKGDAISFGHNIETSWLLWEAATVLEDEVLLERLRPICLAMARAVLEQGLDDDGGLLYEAGPKGIQDTDKHWWTQAEAVVGFWNAWQLSGEGPFASAARRVWTFIQLYIKDGQHGEWHWRTDRAGRPILTEDKGGPWKAPYHNSRMCMEMLKRLA